MNMKTYRDLMVGVLGVVALIAVVWLVVAESGPSCEQQRFDYTMGDLELYEVDESCRAGL